MLYPSPCATCYHKTWALSVNIDESRAESASSEGGHDPLRYMWILADAASQTIFLSSCVFYGVT